MGIKQDIVIWGCGLEGEKFYWTWRHKVNILCAIDMRYQTLQQFHGIEVHSPQDIKSLKQHYIVVCVGDLGIWNEISNKLRANGLDEFEDYIRSDFYGDKKLAVLYGNCHMEAIEKYLKRNPQFSKNYRIRLYYVHNTDGECFPSETAMKNCDLFIAQDINEKNTKGLPNAFALKKMLRKESICIIIPNTYGMNLYFPQCEKGKFGHALKEHFKAFQISADEKKGKELWHKLDWMNEISDANIDLHGKGECILDINTYSSKDIVSNVEKEILKLEEREKLCDVIISDFIRRNYRYKKLFYEPYHPAGVLLKEKGRKILEIIGVAESASDLYIEMDSKELPIYASVSKALDLEFDNKYIRKNTGVPMDVGEYVEHYIRWEIEPCEGADHETKA